MIKYIISVTLFFAASTGFSQIKDYHFKFQLKGLSAGDTVYLANYFGKQLYYNDTAVADKAGNFNFRKKREIQAGQFAVVNKGVIRFELLINEPSFSLKTDTVSPAKNMVIEGSRENLIYFEYINRINAMREQAQPLTQQLDSAKTEPEKEVYRSKLKEMENQLKAFQLKLITENSTTLAGQLIALAVEVDVPETAPANYSSQDSTWRYYYYRDHYFDRADLKFDALARTPVFYHRLDNFITKIVLQHPDTICKVTQGLTAKMNPKGDLFKLTVNQVTDTYNKSDIMGMDAVFVCMADNYYLTGKTFWTDSARVVKIKERVNTVRPTLIGKLAHPLALADTTFKNWVKLYDLKSEFTVLVFWEYTCGHCKKEIPKLAELYNKTAGKDFAVYAVCSDGDEAWKKFIIDNKMNFTNVAIPADLRQNSEVLQQLMIEGKTDYNSLKYQETFDVFSTPKYFILDKDKRIIAKQIGVEQLEGFLTRLKESKKSTAH